MTVSLPAGQVYEVANQQDLRGCTITKSGAGTNPVVRYNGPLESGAFTGSGKLIDIDGEIGPKRYLWNGTGTVSITRATFWGGGGLWKGVNATVGTFHPLQKAASDEYVAYGSGCTVYSDSPDFQFGSINQSIDRQHSCKGYTLINPKYDDTAHWNKAIRWHDSMMLKDAAGHSVPAEMILRCDSAQYFIKGDSWFGTYGAETGPAAPGKRLYKLRVTGVNFTGRSFLLDLGIMDGEFDNCVITNSSGGSVIDTRGDYLGRPHSTVQMHGMTLVHADGTGRVISNEKTADHIRIDGTFNGKPFTH